MCKCDNEDYLRAIIRDEVEKMRQEHLKKNALQGNNLVALYLDNFPADRIKPAGSTVAGQIKLMLKQIKEEQLVIYLPILASAAKPVSSAWINWAMEQTTKKEKENIPTPAPPAYKPEEHENVKAVPMPENFRQAFRDFAKGLND